MAGPGLIYMNEQIYQREDELIIKLKITGAGTQTLLPLNNSAVLAFQTAAVPTQAAIDAFLGSSSEFLAAQFNATSIGVDALGLLVNMSGQKSGVTSLTANPNTNSAQASSVLAYEARMYSGSQGATIVQEGAVSGTLASTSLTAGVQGGSCGNIGVRAVLSGLNALTSGLIVVRIHWISI